MVRVWEVEESEAHGGRRSGRGWGGGWEAEEGIRMRREEGSV